MPRYETLGERIRRVRQERGMSLAKVSGGDFSRAFLNQVEHGRSQPSTRVLRVIAGRLGTEVDYLLEGRLPGIERELALEKGRVLIARGDAKRALIALRPATASSEWPIGTDARLSQAQALRMLGREDEATEILARERELIASHRDGERLKRSRAILRGETSTRNAVSIAKVIATHLRLADRAQRAANTPDALEHYRAARVLLEVIQTRARQRR
jgi:transcriptional regulator with XRE-family HTH domain